MPVTTANAVGRRCGGGSRWWVSQARGGRGGEGMVGTPPRLFSPLSMPREGEGGASLKFRYGHIRLGKQQGDRHWVVNEQQALPHRVLALLTLSVPDCVEERVGGLGSCGARVRGRALRKRLHGMKDQRSRAKQGRSTDALDSALGKSWGPLCLDGVTVPVCTDSHGTDEILLSLFPCCCSPVVGDAHCWWVEEQGSHGHQGTSGAMLRATSWRWGP